MINAVPSYVRRRLGLLLAAVAWGLIAQSGGAQLPGVDLPRRELDTANLFAATARILPASGTQPLQLSITGRVANGWHIYSLTQPAGGPKATLIQLSPSNDYRLAGPLVPMPAPTVKKYPDAWPDLPIEEHEHQVIWTAPIELRAGVDAAKLVIRGEIKTQVCSDRCVDAKVPFEARLAAATLPVSAQAPAPQSPPPGPPAAVDVPRAAPAADFKADFLTLTGQLDRAAVAPGETVHLTLVATPAKGWHLYALADRIPEKDNEPRPTLIVVPSQSNLKFGAPVANRTLSQMKRPYDSQSVDHLYLGPVHFTLPIAIPPSVRPGDYPISGLFGFMTCGDEGCAPPKGVRFTVTVPVEPVSRLGSVPLQFTAATYTEVAQEAAHREAWAQVGGAPALPTISADEAPTEFQLGTLALNLLAAFFGGLILNLMPCVLPVIGLKIMTFVEQAGESRHRVFVLNVWFTAGVVAVFLGLAALAAFTTLGWSGQFQQAGFKIPLAAVVFAFALSLLGVWEIPLPGFVGSHAAHQIAEREGVSGAFAKGALSTLLATPCVGPFMAGPLTWTSNLNSAPLTFAIFGSMGLGMAAPYLVIGARPNLVRFLPKPGAWMETFKHLMGFVLLATVVWIFWTIPPRFHVPTLALLFGLWMGCWWIGRTPLTSELGVKLTAWGVAIIITAVVGMSAFHWLGDGNATSQQIAQSDGLWRPYSPEALQQLRAKHTPVLVDFTAKWCLTCQANKFTALHTKATEKYMRENGIVGLIADKTDEAPEVDQLMVELGHKSKVIPFYAVYPADGGPVITYKQGPLFQGRLLEMLKQAGSSQTVSAASTATKPL